MSEVKFACPACGQHITCDSAKSGTPMLCPTCYRQLVVPQASAGNGSKLILTAAEVQTRPAPTGLTPGPFTPVTVKRSPTAAILLVTFLVVIGAAAIVFRDKLFRPPSDPSHQDVPVSADAAPVPPSLALVPAGPDSGTNWTLDLAAAQIPELPVAGRVHGFEFALHKATITGGTLNLRQGPKWPPDLGLTIYLFATRGEDLAGKTITVEPTRAESPKVTLRWKDAQAQPATENLRGGYALRLEFGAVAGKSLPGKIYLATPDTDKSFLAGTFAAEIRKPSPPKK